MMVYEIHRGAFDTFDTGYNLTERLVVSCQVSKKSQ